MKKKVSLFFLSVFIAVNSQAVEEPFNLLREITLSFFKPMRAKVISVEGSVITSDLTSEEGAKIGMRINIMREGEPYQHPITKEVIGRLENQVGVAEFVEVGSEGARLKLISGSVGAGDIIRVSSQKVKLLFYPLRGVSYSLSEKYYETLKETERFDLLSTSIYTDDEGEIIAEAKRLGADVSLILSQEETPEGVLLRQRLLWTEDINLHSKAEVKISKEDAKRLRFGEELFTPPEKRVFLSFDIPFRVRLIQAGDVNGDGIKEIILSTGKDIMFYTAEKTLKPALGDVMIKGKWSEEHIWLDVFDMNKDGKDEVLVTLLKDDSIVSYAYEYKEKEFIRTHKWNFFLRVIGDKLYGQKYFPGEGFNGLVFDIIDKKSLSLPKGVNLYDFVFIKSEDGETLTLAYDDNAHLNLYNSRSELVWHSKDDYGEFSRKFQKDSPTVMVERGRWSVKDRILVKDGIAVLLRRLAVVKVAPGMGSKNSELIAIRLKELSMEETPLIDYIPGKAVDFVVMDKNILIISFDVRVDMTTILKGMGFVGNKIYIYPLRGRLNVISQ